MGSLCFPCLNKYDQSISKIALINANNETVDPELITAPVVINNFSRYRDAYTDYRIAIIKAYIHYLFENEIFATSLCPQHIIPLSITKVILSYFGPYYYCWGIGSHLTSQNELSNFQHIKCIDLKLFNLNKIYRGKDKYFISSYNSEIYGIGSDNFDGLYLNYNTNNNYNNLQHINSYYKYFNFSDKESEIDCISTTTFTNFCIISLKNGSIYQSKLTLNNGEWNRIFYKPKFNQIIDEKISFSQIKCGLLHSILLTSSGRVYSIGSNDKGQCGVGYISNKINKITIIPLFQKENTKLSSISCGLYHNCCCDIYGNIWCFGLNEYNQCGIINDKKYIQSLPINVFSDNSRSQNRNIIKAECGESFTVFLDSDNNYDGFGKIIVSTLDRVNIKKWNYLNNDKWKFKDMSCGFNHVILISIDNIIYAHGSNEFSKCGIRIGRAFKPTPVKNDSLPKHLKPVTVIAGTSSSLIIYK